LKGINRKEEILRYAQNDAVEEFLSVNNKLKNFIIFSKLIGLIHKED